jgi:hypothetical protein
MPISPYFQPQLTIRQELERTSSSQTPRMAACIIGPAYLLSRYGQEETEAVPHLLAGQTLPWRYVDAAGDVQVLPAGYSVDTAAAKLFAEDLRAPLAAFTDDDLEIVLDSINAPHIIKIVAGFTFTTAFGTDPNELAAAGHTFSADDKVRLLTTGTLPAPLSGNTSYFVVNPGSGILELALTAGGTPISLTSDGTGAHKLVSASEGSAVLAGTGLDAAFRGRDCAVGDEVVVNDGTADRTRKIVGFLGQDVPSTFGTNTAKDNALASNAAYNPITDATADAAVALLTPAGFSQTISQTAVDFNVRGSSLVDRKVAEEFTVTVTEGGTTGSGSGSATFSISSKSGIYAATGVKSTDSGGNYLINDSELAGATVTLVGGTVSVGQVFKFRVYQAYEQLAFPANIVVAGTYTGPRDTTYIIEVTQGSTGDSADDAEVKIYDTEGLEDTQDEVVVVDDTPLSLGAYGLTVEFLLSVATVAQAGLRAGDKYFVHAVAAAQSATVFDKAVLDGPVIDPATFVNLGQPLGAVFSLRYTGEIEATAAADATAWTADADDGIVVDAALALYVAERSAGYEWVSFENNTGELHTSFRATVPTDSSQGMGYVDSDADIAAKIGPIALDNDLAFGVSEALRGAQGRRVYFVNTGGTTAAEFAIACKKLEATDAVWALCPLTTDPAVKATVESHVLAMSAPDKKQFRKVYTAIDSPGKYVIYEKQANGSPYLATITDNGGENLLVTLTPPADGTDFDSISVVAGDLVRIVSSGVEYPIASKVSALEYLLQRGPALPISPAVPIQVWKADTADSQAAFINQAANALTDRRATQIWYEDGTRIISGNAPTIIPARFAAAEVVGLRSALPPQVGLTRTEIQAITAAPAMYNKYGIDDLDGIASNGTLIVTQTAESGAVFIRHQLTTDTDNGLLYYEDNITMIVDYLSFRFKDEFEDLIGKVNVTDGTIADLFSRSVTILDSEKQADIDSIYGPLIVDYQDLSVQRDPALKDRINIRVKISVPIPMNTLDITFETYVSLADAA